MMDFSTHMNANDCKKVALLLCFNVVAHIFGGISSVNANVPADFEQKIDEFAEKVLSCRDMVGLNLAVVKDGTTVMTAGYGKINLEENHQVSSTTHFGIASLTKAFATTGLSIVMEEAPRYNWDSKTREVFGHDFFFYDAIRSSESSLRDLAAHKIGLSPNNNARLQGGLTRERLAEKVRFYEPTLPFRESYRYNNLMFGLISYATEKIGGDSWENILDQKIFKPLGMDSTTFSHVADMRRRDIATPYLYDNDNWRSVSSKLHSEWGSLGGSGSILSNAEDMANWLKFNLDNGNSPTNNKSVMSAESLEELHTPQNIIPESNSDKLYRKPVCPVSYTSPNYGLGWRVGSYRGYRMVMHTGTSWGYGGQLILIPDKNIGVYSSITGHDSGYHGRRALHLFIIDLLLGETPWHNLTSACSYLQGPSRKRTSNKDNAGSPSDSADSLLKYEGMYGNFGYGNLTVKYNESEGALEMLYGDLGRWILRTTSTPDEFTGEGQDDVWYMNLRGVIFTSVDDVYSQVSVTSFNSDLPPVFTRGLQMDSAPPPPTLECSTSSGSWLHVTIYMYIMINILYMLPEF